MNIVKKYLLKAAEYSLFCAIPMTFGIASIVSDFIPWYLGSEFNLVIYTTIILSPIIITNSLAGISGSQFFTATNQVNVLLKVYISATVLNIILNIMLITRFSSIGAAIATSFSSIISVYIQFYYLDKQMHIKSLLQCGVKYLLKSIPMIIVVIMIGLKLDSQISTTLLQIIIGMFIYGMTLILIKDRLIKELFEQFKRFMSKRYKN